MAPLRSPHRLHQRPLIDGCLAAPPNCFFTDTRTLLPCGCVVLILLHCEPGWKDNIVLPTFALLVSPNIAPTPALLPTLRPHTSPAPPSPPHLVVGLGWLVLHAHAYRLPAFATPVYRGSSHARPATVFLRMRHRHARGSISPAGVSAHTALPAGTARGNFAHLRTRRLLPLARTARRACARDVRHHPVINSAIPKQALALVPRNTITTPSTIRAFFSVSSLPA